MQNIVLDGETRKIGEPRDWQEERDGPCATLSIQDVEEPSGNWMVSAWKFSEEEIEKLRDGHLFLWIRGIQHPVIGLGVGDSSG